MDRLAEIGRAWLAIPGMNAATMCPWPLLRAVRRLSRSISRPIKPLEGNDHTVSLLPEEFTAMVRQIRDIEESIGTAAPRRSFHR